MNHTAIFGSQIRIGESLDEERNQEESRSEESSGQKEEVALIGAFVAQIDETKAPVKRGFFIWPHASRHAIRRVTRTRSIPSGPAESSANAGYRVDHNVLVRVVHIDSLKETGRNDSILPQITPPG